MINVDEFINSQILHLFSLIFYVYSTQSKQSILFFTSECLLTLIPPQPLLLKVKNKSMGDYLNA